MASDKGSKTEKPTPRKLRKAREKGQIARSREIPLVATLLGMLLILYYFGSTVVQTLEREIYTQLRLSFPPEFTISVMTTMARDIVFRMGALMLPILLAIAVISIASNVAQGGLAVSSNSLKPKFNKLNPTQGIKKIFSKNGLVNLAKSLVLITAIGIISWQVIRDNLTLYPRLVLMDVRQIFHWATTISFTILMRVAIFMIVISLADYLFQKYQFKKQLKMSKQEVKDEYKEMEGDPTTKRRIRRVQLEMARKRMMNDVPTADVVITNPTHYAAALSYKMDSMAAPKVIAKGSNLVAQKIKELAAEHNIPIVENKPLAQTLYKTVKVGDYIPMDLYKAVAEILAYVFQARNMYQR
jgi:flagellar biosynthetic protein FlhB